MNISLNSQSENPIYFQNTTWILIDFLHHYIKRSYFLEKKKTNNYIFVNSFSLWTNFKPTNIWIIKWKRVGTKKKTIPLSWWHKQNSKRHLFISLFYIERYRVLWYAKFLNINRKKKKYIHTSLKIYSPLLLVMNIYMGKLLI